MEVNIYKTSDNAEGNLFAGIGAATLSFQLESGQGDLFPQPYFGNTTSLGTSILLNATGIGSTGIQVGDFILNETDGSHAFVLEVSANSLTTSELQGGSGNVWGNGDAYRVNPFVVTLNYRDSGNNVTQQEQVYVINRVDDVFTIETGGRGFAGTTPQIWNASTTYVNLFIISSLQDQLRIAIADLSRQMDQKASVATVSGLFETRNWKQSVKCATTTALTLSSDVENGDTIDGVTLTTGDRVLIKDQAAGEENGIYVVKASGAPDRADDMDESDEFSAAVVAVEEGTSNADAIFMCTTDSPTVGTTPIVFIEIASALSKASTAEAEAGTDDTKYMTPLKVRQAMTLLQQKVTYGASINGTTTPQATWRNPSDGKIYLTDANAANADATWEFIGFSKENKVNNDEGYVISDGVVEGFSSLTPGEPIYLSDTAGAVSHTPSTTRSYLIGKAISATAIRIDKQDLKQYNGTVSISNPSIGNFTDLVVNTPFRPRRINIKGHIGICDSGGTFCRAESFDKTWEETTNRGGLCIRGAGQGSVGSPDYITSNNLNPVALPTSGTNRSSLTFSIQAVTNSSFTMRVTNTLTNGIGSSNALSSPITYEVEP